MEGKSFPQRRPARGRDRRSSPRIDVTDQLRAAVARSGAPIRILDISFGGCLVESEAPFPIGTLQQFDFETLDRSLRLTVTARVVHSRSDSSAAPHATFVTGLQFVAPRTPESAAEFDRLMDALTAVLTFE